MEDVLIRISLLVALAAAFAGACAPATVQLARTNGQGNFQLGLEPGLLAGAAPETLEVIPSFNVAGRYGVSDRVDLGARIGTGTYELQLKHLFTDPAATDAIAIALAPSTTVLWSGPDRLNGALWNTRVPLLFGLPVGGGSELTFGPSAMLTVLGGDGSGGVGLSAGGQVGFAVRVADRFRIVPQIDLMAPVVGASVASGESSLNPGGGALLFGAQLGFLVGGPR
jgi:hypothetical protein